MCKYICYLKFWQDTAWYIFGNSDVEKLRIYFYFMDYYNTFQKKELKSGVTELILFQEGQS